MRVNKVLVTFFHILFSDRLGGRFLLAVIISLGFSIGIILSTIGLMDGFQNSLSHGLRKSLGDVVLVSRKGLFEFSEKITESLRKTNLLAHSSAYQVEGFLVSSQGSRGVRLLGIRPFSYQQVTDKKISLGAGEIAIGSEIAKDYSLKGGDSVELAFVSSNSQGDVLPILYSFIVKQIIHHGVYEKDSRMVYTSREYLSEIGLSQKDNIIFGLFSQKNLTKSELDKSIILLKNKVGSEFKVRLFGGEYQSLLHAVELEKISITIILQIIVIVAVFNIGAFVSFISERKSREFFLLRAMGLPFKKIFSFWMLFISLLWASSCLCAIAFTWTFGLLLKHLPWFKIPGKIYVLSQLNIDLSIAEYFLVFLISGFWILLVSLWVLYKMGRGSLLQGLRNQFS